MSKFNIKLINLLFLTFCTLSGSQIQSLTKPDPYCFRFTWVGPISDPAKIKDLTCGELLQDMNSIPCRQPLVATNNNKRPDTDLLWYENRHQPDTYGCALNPGESCAKYTYYYNKGIQNITYLCAKVNATNGCNRQKSISGSEVEVCVCKTRAGEIPCNYGSQLQQSLFVVMTATLAALLYTVAKIS